MHSIKSGPGLYTHQVWRPLVYISKRFYHLVNALTEKADIRTKKKS